ncbi:hypothetical protein T484DRAFT_1813959 [Baffinella frigidus]|nr:hypothetical protein T484DRAFT_1813959 [Cryptophyta sp. CCMP2293]
MEIQSAIDYVLVTNPGSGYVGATTLVPNVLASTCINFVLTTQPSGYITKVTIQSNGDGYAQDPAFTISSGGVGCTGFTLLGKVGDMTGDTLPSLPTASLIYLASSGSSIDSYYNGMSIAFTSGANAGVMRNILSYSADGRTVTVETAFAQQLQPVHILYRGGGGGGGSTAF